MKLTCVKDCMNEELGSRLFTANCDYSVLGSNEPDGYAVFDDECEPHWIGWPGEAFFDEYFRLAGNDGAGDRTSDLKPMDD